MNKPLISIITPLYNAADHILETLQSVLAQQWTDWEHIVVDDCSTDHSPDYVKQQAAADDRIRYHRLPRNSGAATARNTGIGLARGRYLCFLDSDDVWEQDKLSRQLAFMQEHNSAFTFTEYNMIDEKGTVIKKRVASPRRISYLGLLCGSPIMCSSVMLDRKQVKQIEMPQIRSGQDYATWALILRDQVRYAENVGAVLAHYRKQKSSLSSHKLRAFKRTWRINRKWLGVNLPLTLCCVTIYGLRWIAKHYL